MSEGPEHWERIYAEFAPEEPATQPTQRAERDYSPVPDINRSLSRSFGDKKFLITGSVGTGKTTELHRIAEAQVERQFVVMFDVHGQLINTLEDPHAINNLESWELLFLLGLAVYRAAETVLGHRWAPEVGRGLAAAHRALQSGSEAEVDVGALASSVLVLVGGVGGAALGGPVGGAVGGAALRAVGDAAKSVRWTLPMARRDRVPSDDQDGRVAAMLAAVNRIIGEVQKSYRSVLLLLDGLDRITDRAQLEALFVHSRLLAELVCPMVAIAPISVRRGHMDIVRGFSAKDLVNVPVVSRDRPSYPHLGPGVAFFHELVKLRMAKLGLDEREVVSAQQIDRMAWCSGGRVRDFVSLVRGVAERAFDAGAEQATDAHVDAAVDEARRKKESGIDADEIALLEQVLRDERRALPGGPEAVALLDKQRLVPYPNESTWYFPHPLLTLSLLKSK